MASLVIDPYLAQRLIAERREKGTDRYDEVWEGIYVMAPMPNNEHQVLVGEIYSVLKTAIQKTGETIPGVNISDRDEDWEHNFRCPDVVVFLNETKAVNRETYWLGGPDFAVEIASQHDQTRDKLDFYGKVGTRELLIVDRYPWSLELYRLTGQDLKLVGKSTLENSDVLTSQVVPLSWQLVPGEARPLIAVTQSDGQQKWAI